MQVRDLVQIGVRRGAWYQPVKYRVNGVATNRIPATGGKDSTFANRECSRATSRLRHFTGSTRSASVTGAPRHRNTGVTIDRTMCWIMCTLISVSS